MQESERKAAIDAYRERKVACGIYAIRCVPSQQLWVGSAPNLATIQNRLWFTLRLGQEQRATLQQAWTTHGEAAFEFDILEQWDAAEIGHARNRALKAGLNRWADTLGASPI
ncbi:hypothetical protein CP98_01304 [Sphingobium yanoikuyae]|jgi:hypothetical protein|uniref:GIY-YIG nuclease family protein n=2 Tax=Sphingobium yanoikuyae TaxID=13690 RepID=A0A084EQ57_SPHYA|nr:hypothetical protein CP98_01304 [Sphingobium yanoikuyae]